MIRILHISYDLNAAGHETFIMNVYKNIDRTKYQFDFLLHNKAEGGYDEQVLDMGGRIYYLPHITNGILKNHYSLKRFFAEHNEYSTVHMHIGSLKYIEPLIAAKNAGVPVRIVHSHNSFELGGKLHQLLHNINKKRIAGIATDYLACSGLAADWFFDGTAVRNKAVIINNGIDIKSFEYNENIRAEERKALGLANSLTIGHIGRLHPQKNHSFLLKIFGEICRKYSDMNPRLMLIGDGPDREDIKVLWNNMGLSDRVMYLGVRHDIPRLIQAMDAFVLPSLYEGFGIVALEAQAAGLPCFLSDVVPDSVVIKPNCHRISLNEHPEKWADRIIEDRKIISDNSSLAVFDVRNTVMQLIDIYR